MHALARKGAPLAPPWNIPTTLSFFRQIYKGKKEYKKDNINFFYDEFVMNLFHDTWLKFILHSRY